MIPSNIRLKKRCKYTLRRLNSLDKLFKPADDILDKAEREKRGAAAVVGIAAKMLPVLAKFGMKYAVPLMSTWTSREIVQMKKELKVNKHDLDKLNYLDREKRKRRKKEALPTDIDRLVQTLFESEANEDTDGETSEFQDDVQAMGLFNHAYHM